MKKTKSYKFVTQPKRGRKGAKGQTRKKRIGTNRHPV